MTDGMLRGEALKEYEAFEHLFRLYQQDAIANFLLKYPMLKKYKHNLSCSNALIESSHGVALELKFDGDVTMIHAIAMAKTGDMTEWNHKLGEMKQVQTPGPLVITVRLQLERFYFTPLSGEILTM